MRDRKCYCASCDKNHLVEMDDDETKEMINVAGLHLGRIRIACGKCSPHPGVQAFWKNFRHVMDGKIPLESKWRA
jgi:hypothetical protein